MELQLCKLEEIGKYSRSPKGSTNRVVSTSEFY